MWLLEDCSSHQSCTGGVRAARTNEGSGAGSCGSGALPWRRRQRPLRVPCCSTLHQLSKLKTHCIQLGRLWCSSAQALTIPLFMFNPISLWILKSLNRHADVRVIRMYFGRAPKYLKMRWNLHCGATAHLPSSYSCNTPGANDANMRHTFRQKRQSCFTFNVHLQKQCRDGVYYVGDRLFTERPQYHINPGAHYIHRQIAALQVQSGNTLCSNTRKSSGYTP